VKHFVRCCSSQVYLNVSLFGASLCNISWTFYVSKAILYIHIGMCAIPAKYGRQGYHWIWKLYINRVLLLSVIMIIFINRGCYCAWLLLFNHYMRALCINKVIFTLIYFSQFFLEHLKNICFYFQCIWYNNDFVVRMLTISQYYWRYLYCNGNILQLISRYKPVFFPHKEKEQAYTYCVQHAHIASINLRL
jgi:hypothetical protein